MTLFHSDIDVSPVHRIERVLGGPEFFAEGWELDLDVPNSFAAAIYWQRKLIGRRYSRVEICCIRFPLIALRQAHEDSKRLLR